MRQVRLALGTVHTDRLLALTDGVYAIVLTLLVLDLKAPEVPGLSNPELRQDLIEQGPNFLAYFVSFFAVSYFWVLHNRVFASVKKCDGRTVIGNLVHLLLISLSPYTASLIGHYEGQRVAACMFSIVLGLTSFSGTRLAAYVARHDDWHDEDAETTRVDIPWWRLHFGTFLAVASLILTLVDTSVALAVWFLLPVRNYLLFSRLR